MVEFFNSPLLVFILLGIMIIATIPLIQLLRLVYQLLEYFRKIENRLKRMNL